jgi:hypothetical protein
VGRKKKEEESFDLEAWELNIYRLTITVGQWHDTDAFFPRVGHLVPAEVFRVLVKMGRRKNPMETNDVELSEQTKTLLIRRADAGCVSCRYILDDWATNNKLTDYGNYPAEAKINHIEAEKAGQVA